MQSKNKKAQTVAESDYVRLVAQVPCVICDAEGVEVHEFEQGAWFASAALCPPCHRGPDGWHGTRRRWTLRKRGMVYAINETMRRVWALIR